MDNVSPIATDSDPTTMDHFVTVIFQTKEILASVGSHVFTKGLLSVLGVIGANLLGEENYKMLLFLGTLIVIDLLTGMIASITQGQPIQSRKAFKTATKATVYLLFFSASYLTHNIVPYSEFITTGVISFLAITELLSVMENMAKMGYALPAKLLNQIRTHAGIETWKEGRGTSFGNGER